MLFLLIVFGVQRGDRANRPAELRGDHPSVDGRSRNFFSIFRSWFMRLNGLSLFLCVQQKKNIQKETLVVTANGLKIKGEDFDQVRLSRTLTSQLSQKFDAVARSGYARLICGSRTRAYIDGSDSCIMTINALP